jgi:hypothetical protein
VNSIGRSRRRRVVAGSESLLSSAGGSLLVDTAGLVGLDQALSAELGRWRSARALHDPGKVVLDLAIAIALGGDCLADVAVVRSQPDLFGPVASDPTVSRLFAALAADADAALAALRAAHAQARARFWKIAPPVDDEGVLIVDIDATTVAAHSEKEGARPTFKRGFGFAPMLAFLDHGPGGVGECVAGVLRPGNANAIAVADNVAALTLALEQLTPDQRTRVLVRGDSGAGTHGFVQHLHDLKLQYSVGMTGREPVLAALAALPRQSWKPALDADGEPREGAQVAELTRFFHSPDPRYGWPDGMRLIARRERPHPGAQLRITDADGWRITVFATNVRGGRIAELELQHRLRARAEDRIRCLKDTGMRNLPLHDFAANRIWLQVAMLAADLLTWTQALALAETAARCWEPKRLRLRLLHVAGRLVRSGRREWLRLPRAWPWTPILLTGHANLNALAA